MRITLSIALAIFLSGITAFFGYLTGFRICEARKTNFEFLAYLTAFSSQELQSTYFDQRFENLYQSINTGDSIFKKFEIQKRREKNDEYYSEKAAKVDAAFKGSGRKTPWQNQSELKQFLKIHRF